MMVLIGANMGGAEMPVDYTAKSCDCHVPTLCNYRFCLSGKK